MARVKVVIHDEAIDSFLEENPAVKNVLLDQGRKVLAEAEATASEAEGGDGGRLTGYAAAGFSLEYEKRSSGRPRVNIRSNLTDGEMLARIYFSTQKRWGVTHLRRALYSITGGR